MEQYVALICTHTRTTAGPSPVVQSTGFIASFPFNVLCLNFRRGSHWYLAKTAMYTDTTITASEVNSSSTMLEVL